MIFGNPVVNIKPVDSTEELIVIFGYGDTSHEVLVTNKRIYCNSKNEFVANETIIGLDSVEHTNFRYHHKKENRIPWIGGALVLFSIILLAFTIAANPYVDTELGTFLFPALYTLIGAIAVFGVVLSVKKLSKSTTPRGMPKGVIYIHYGEPKPFRIFIFEGDLAKIRQAHYRINDAIDQLKRFGKHDASLRKKQ